MKLTARGKFVVLVLSGIAIAGLFLVVALAPPGWWM